MGRGDRGFWRVLGFGRLGLGNVLGGLLLLGGCAPASEAPSRELRELERLAFVPRGTCYLPGYRPADPEDPVNVSPVWRGDVSLKADLLVDRFESTRADCEAYGVSIGPGAGQPPWDSDVTGLTAETADWPAYLTWNQAQLLGERRGMRLPTAAEWLYVATGGRAQAYPYSMTSAQKGFANTLDLQLGRPAPVGTFEAGKSLPFGCYDVQGNVWEWVADAVRDYTDPDKLAQMAFLGSQDVVGRRSSVMGGSYLSRDGRLFEYTKSSEGTLFQAQLLDRGTLRPDVGVRLVADAAAYLRTHAARWGTSPAARERVRAVGAAWAQAVYRERICGPLWGLADEPGAAPALTWLAEGANGGAR